MNGKRSAAAWLPIVACVSSLAQDRLQSNHKQHPKEKEKSAILPDLRLEPVAVRIAQGRLYGLVPLADGRILAFDRRDRQPVYLMTRSRPANGTYTLTFQGSLVVHDGIVKELTDIAQSSAHTLSLDGRGNLVVKWRVRLPAGAASQTAKGQPALSVIDLKDGRLMFLEGNRISHLKTRLAPDDQYTAPGLGSLSVRKGTLGPIAEEPDYMLADDYAP